MGLEVADLISSATITEYAANSLQRNPLDSSESVGRNYGDVGSRVGGELQNATEGSRGEAWPLWRTYRNSPIILL
jgi:hypothetical protein